MDVIAACFSLLIFAIGIDILVFFCPTLICSTPVYQRCNQCGKDIYFTGINAHCSGCGKEGAQVIPAASLMVTVVVFFLGFSKPVLFRPLLTSSYLMVLFLLMVAVSAFDLNYGLIPNKILALALLPAGAGMVTGRLLIWEHLYAALVIISIMCLLGWGGKKFWGRTGVGAGDIKLLAVMALFTGWDILWISYGGFLLGGIFGVVGLYTGSLSIDSRIPMAPFLSVGYVLYYMMSPLWEVLIS